jgi:hypothetical protein
MSELEKISGVIDFTTNMSSTTGQINTDINTGHVYGSIQTGHWINFRVNNRPCKWEGVININNGDQVTVVGKKKAELEVLVLANETTNITYTQNDKSGLLKLYRIYLGTMAVIFLFTLSGNTIATIIFLFFFLVTIYILINLKNVNVIEKR